MPLVVPSMMTSGASANSNDNTNEAWMNKMLGKTLTDGPSDETKFSKKDLPKEHRIIEHGHAKTMDYKPDRLNVHLGPDGTVTETGFDDGRS